MLEGLAASRARASIQGLTALVPKTALVEKDGQTTEVSAESLAVGATILVRPGDRIPADGSVVEGSGEVDEAPVTGESVPKRKVSATPSSRELSTRAPSSGCASRPRALTTRSPRVVRLVEEAQESKSPTERFIDRFSKVYTPAVLVVASSSPWCRRWSPGGLERVDLQGLGDPPDRLPLRARHLDARRHRSRLSAGARRGLLMKGGVVLENPRRVTAIAFDKTGTLTAGKPVVTDIVAVGRPARGVLSLAAALEKGSKPSVGARDPRPGEGRQRPRAARLRRQRGPPVRVSRARSAARPCSSGRRRPPGAALPSATSGRPRSPR